MQVALKATQKQLTSIPSQDVIAERSELEGALKQAVKDYQLLLKEMTNIRGDVKRKDGKVSDLSSQLHNAHQELARYKYAYMMMMMYLCTTVPHPHGY